MSLDCFSTLIISRHLIVVQHIVKDVAGGAPNTYSVSNFSLQAVAVLEDNSVSFCVYNNDNFKKGLMTCTSMRGQVLTFLGLFLLFASLFLSICFFSPSNYFVLMSCHVHHILCFYFWWIFVLCCCLLSRGKPVNG